MRLRHLWLFATLLFAVLEASLIGQSAEPWQPVTPRDLSAVAPAALANASAIRLYYSYFKDDNAKFVTEYQRIKILNTTGLKYADIVIPVSPGESIKQLNARTIHPDGSIVDFTAKPFEKTIVKSHGVSFVAKTFTLPDVTVGSIVEYSYFKLLVPNQVDAVSEWLLQDDLYTIQKRLRFQPTSRYVDVASEWDQTSRRSQSICTYANQTGAAVPEIGKSGLIEINLTSVPSFAGEDYMPPHVDYEPALICFYGGREFASPEQFWPVWQERLSKFNETWIGKPAALSSAVEQTLNGETDSEKKLRRLYARVQQIRNLSFERDRTAKEEKKEKLKPNQNPKDVLDHGYGTRWEIDALFVALARTAGFEASLVYASDRYSRSFEKKILWLGQLDGIAAMVSLNGKDVFLDPGTRFCPFGTLDWRHSEATALSTKPGGSFLTTSEGQMSVSKRSTNLELAADGSAHGEITLELNGQEALIRRIAALETDESGARKNLEDEVLAWLPSGSQAKLLDAQGWNSTDDSLKIRLHVEIPQYASVTKKRLVLPLNPIPTPFKTVFSEPSRQYPIVFSFPFAENDDLTLQFPEGYAPESVPGIRKAGLSYAAYEISTTLQGNKLVTRRNFRLSKILFEIDSYPMLQNFFNVVHGGDAAQVVLQAKSSNEASQ